MIDEVCEYVCSQMPAKRWVNLHEINKIIRGYGLKEAEVEAVLNFLKEYFFEVDKSKERVRLIPSFYNLVNRDR